MATKPSKGGKSDLPATQRIASSIKQLATGALEMNAAAEALCENIAPLDQALAKYNLGVSAWFQISGNEHEDGRYWSRDIGYAQVDRTWGIVLRKAEGFHQDPDGEREELWLFKDAPRWMQIESVTKIPDLFDKLIRRVNDTTEKLKAKSQQAKELTDALNAALAEIGTTEQ